MAAHLVAASLLISQTASLSGALTDAHIDHLVYKGAALGALQGGVSSRGAGDVDVLVEPEDIPRVDWVLKDRGYRPAQQLPPVGHRGSWKFITTIDREVAYTGRPVGVDVHWRISPPRHLFATPRELFQRSITLDVGGVGVPTAAAGDALAMACFHAYYDRFSQLRAMVDIHRLIPLALQSRLPPLSPALGRLTAGVLTLHRELFPGIVDDEITELLTLLPKPLPMVRKVWERCGGDPTCREATRHPGLLWQRFLAELAYDHPIEALPRWVAKRLVFFPPATAVGQHQSLPRAFGSQLVRIAQGRAS
ncbi:nucleotidyltransferase [Pontimonas salivibrio]|uniref:Nucleotidyltransferase n=1 Tax=Pontimonas salivibrio TaxID=1159327 RepID=A0A2L2BP66_9MICO|nr:nucleotidyltransferase [Pontimonas salivibrio]